MQHLACRPCARGQDRGSFDKETVRVHGACEECRLATDRRLRIVVTETLDEHVADPAELIYAAEDLVPPNLAMVGLPQPGGRFPRHRLAGADVDHVVPGTGLRQLLRAEDLHRLPES